MTFLKEEQNGIAIIDLEGEVDFSSAEQTKTVLRDAIKNQKKVMLLVDLSKVTYMDSSGVGALVEILQKVENKGGQFKVSGLSANVEYVFKVSKLFSFFEIHPEKSKALRSFK